MAWHGTARHGMAREGMACHGKAWHGTARHGTDMSGSCAHLPKELILSITTFTGVFLQHQPLIECSKLRISCSQWSLCECVGLAWVFRAAGDTSDTPGSAGRRQDAWAGVQER